LAILLQRADLGRIDWVRAVPREVRCYAGWC